MSTYAANYWAGAPLGARPQLEWLAPEITVLREARCSGRLWGDGRAAINAVRVATYPSTRSLEFEATLPPERRELVRRWLPGHHRPLWSRFYEFVATAPLAEIEEEVARWEAELAKRAVAGTPRCAISGCAQ